MSQQYPGQPAGGGMPPGYGGGTPPGQGGGMPPGYGGGMPPGGGMPHPSNSPPGMPPQPAPLQAQAPKSNQPLLMMVGIGCGGLMLLGVAAVVGGVFWFKARTNAAIEDLQKLQASASAMPSLPVPPLGLPAGTRVAGELAGDCKIAYACCKAIAAKTTASAAAAEACELFKTAGYPEATCSVSLTGYRKAAEVVGIRCD